MVIELYLSNGKDALINHSNISSVIEAGASSQWHGVKRIITMKCGTRHEVNESYSSVKHKIEKARLGLK